MSGVEREPLTITLPHGATETTVYLVSAYCEPHATRATEQEARTLCETAERANLEAGAEFVWHPTDDTELTHELYVVLGDEFRTEYTVTPIHLRQEQDNPTRQTCPAWCTTKGEHTLHYRLVGQQGDVTVALHQTGDHPEVAIYDPGVAAPTAARPLTPATARIIGQGLVDGGRATELGEALIRAAALIEAAE